MSLEKAYQVLEQKFSRKINLEPFSIVKSADSHRRFWKPYKVKTLLLAESHVYTSVNDHDNIMHYEKFPNLNGCPVNYVRLVYCLGYGEQKLANVTNNRGTPQFWKIFASCINQDVDSEAEKIQSSKTPNFHERLNNKITLLEKLKENGIWLVDASIVALYKDSIKPSPAIMQGIIHNSWKLYVSDIIEKEQPERIIVIGKGVARILERDLIKTRIPYYIQSQPQGIRSGEELRKSFEKYYKICNKQF